jgi:peptide/nickel transport system substrate-binding protein
MVSNDTPDTVYLERNPYFWMVDPEGNQLPYVDEMTQDRIADIEMYNAKIVAGEVDFAGFNTNIQNYSAYQDAAEKGGYRILLWKSAKGGEVWYQVNLAANDPVKREVFQDDRFRQALSLAINRDEINDVIYFGRATPRQMTVLPTSRYFKQEYADAFADYDPDRANELLDEMGLQWDADEVNRLQPDGQPLIINWSLYESETPKGPITELVKEYWAAVGVEINYKSVARQLLNTQIHSNEYEMVSWHGDAVSDVLLATTQSDKWLVGGNWSNGWAWMWKLWATSGGEDGEEPPQWFKDLWDTKREFERSYDAELIHQVLRNQAERCLTIGTVGNAPHPLIVNNKLRNVVEEGFFTWDSLFGVPYYAEQWFFEQS